MVTAGLFLSVWVDPSDWRRDMVAHGMLIMLVEFILIHSSGFIGPIVFADDVKRSSRIKAVVGLILFYTVFVAVWAWQFQSWWALIFFLWLTGAKVVDILLNRRITDELRMRQHSMVPVSMGIYLICVFVTILLPVPELGLTHHGHYYGMPGSGEWVSNPHIVIAAAVWYFSLLAFAKLNALNVVLARLNRQ